MERKWKITGTALLLAIAIPASAYAADSLYSKGSETKQVAQSKPVVGKEDKKSIDGKVIPDEIATKLGLDKAAYVQAVKDGKSLADIAKEKGIELQPLIDELSQQMLSKIQLKKDPKELTDEERNNMNKKVTMESQRVFETPLVKLIDGKGDNRPADGKTMALNYPEIATKLGLDQAAYDQAVKDGKSYADIAKEKGIELQPLIDELTQQLLSKIQLAKDAKQLTDEETNNMKKKVAMESQRIFGTPLIQQQKKGDTLDWNMKAAFDLMGIDKAYFGEQIQDGKSLAEIAQARGISRQQLEDALASDLNAQIADLVKRNVVTQDQADKKKQALLQTLDTFVDSKSLPELKK